MSGEGEERRRTRPAATGAAAAHRRHRPAEAAAHQQDSARLGRAERSRRRDAACDEPSRLRTVLGRCRRTPTTTPKTKTSRRRGRSTKSTGGRKRTTNPTSGTTTRRPTSDEERRRAGTKKPKTTSRTGRRRGRGVRRREPRNQAASVAGVNAAGQPAVQLTTLPAADLSLIVESFHVGTFDHARHAAQLRSPAMPSHVGVVVIGIIIRRSGPRVDDDIIESHEP